jgi:hypothetical protein
MGVAESRSPADTLRAMVLYTCPAQKHGATTPIAGAEAIVTWASR